MGAIFRARPGWSYAGYTDVVKSSWRFFASAAGWFRAQMTRRRMAPRRGMDRGAGMQLRFKNMF